MLHPHVHCVVTGGGPRPDGTWASTGDGFFLPVRVLGKLYRGLFLAALEEKLRAGELILPNEVSHPSEMAQLLLRVRSQRWVVYSKPPFGGPAQVLAYLGRYTHRTAISNARLVASSDGRVTFRHKRRCSDERWREMTLGAEEFLRRFALHVLPKGFERIRYWGLLANRKRSERLEACRTELGAEAPAEKAELQTTEDEGAMPGPPNIGCPRCHRRWQTHSW